MSAEKLKALEEPSIAQQQPQDEAPTGPPKFVQQVR
jgi:hypothetical protein